MCTPIITQGHKATGLALLIMLASCTAGKSHDTTSSGCSGDNDCKGNRICVAGQCVDPSGPGASSAADATGGAGTSGAGSSAWSLAGSTSGVATASSAAGSTAAPGTSTAGTSAAPASGASSASAVASHSVTSGTTPTSNAATSAGSQGASIPWAGSSSGDIHPTQGVYVVLTWNTDVTDLDLHVVREDPPGSAAFPKNTAADCYYNNCSATVSPVPLWDPASLATQGGNPSLLVDDTNGYGPEATAIVAPLVGRYKVLVNYYKPANTTTLPRTTATITVYLNGVRVAQPSRALQGGAFWDVGNVEWPSPTAPTFTLIDQVDNSAVTGGGSSSGGTAQSGASGLLCDPVLLLTCTFSGGQLDAQCHCNLPSASSSSGGSGASSAAGVYNVGAPCAGNSDCHAGGLAAFCEMQHTNGSWPQGYCSATCRATGSCGPQAECIDLGNAMFPNLLCFTQCPAGSTNTCRQGYACSPVPAQTWGFCYAGCRTSADCATGYTCDLSTLLCK